jgi:hypothetical protein
MDTLLIEPTYQVWLRDVDRFRIMCSRLPSPYSKNRICSNQTQTNSPYLAPKGR